MTTSDAPDPLDDPEGYALYCEMHACRNCDGCGEVCCDEDEGIDGVHECHTCGGSGVDPSATAVPDYDENDD